MHKLSDKIKITYQNIRQDDRLIKKLILANVIACSICTTAMGISGFNFIHQAEKHIDLQKQKEIETSQALDDEIAKTKDRMIATAIATHISSALTLATFYPTVRLGYDYIQKKNEEQNNQEENQNIL